jgi:DNA-binding FadR family transcriptional regulator
MIEMLRIHPLPSEERDHDAHVALTEAIGKRDASASALHSRTHLTSLKTMLL